MNWNRIIIAGFICGWLSYTSYLNYRIKSQEEFVYDPVIVVSDADATAMDCGILATLTVITDMLLDGKEWPGAEVVHRQARKYIEDHSGRSIPWDAPTKSPRDALPES